VTSTGGWAHKPPNAKNKPIIALVAAAEAMIVRAKRQAIVSGGQCGNFIWTPPSE
jgi:hypothetical protein